MPRRRGSPARFSLGALGRASKKSKLELHEELSKPEDERRSRVTKIGARQGVACCCAGWLPAILPMCQPSQIRETMSLFAAQSIAA
ncbi:unnamed protein product [Urochloa humidicola]